MIMFRPHRGSLQRAMQEAKEFDSIDEMLQYICKEHNYHFPFFTIKPSDIYIEDTGYSDERVKWHNMFYLIFERASKISNIEGFCKYFGIKMDDPSLLRDEYFLEDKPMDVIGMFSTDYKKVNL